MSVIFSQPFSPSVFWFSGDVAKTDSTEVCSRLDRGGIANDTEDRQSRCENELVETDRRPATQLCGIVNDAKRRANYSPGP